MNKSMTSANLVQWLAQEAKNIAQTTSQGQNPSPDLWLVATDAQSWLRSIATDERDEALRRVEQCVNTGLIDGVAISTDEHEAACFTTLLEWVSHPPAIL